MKIKNYISNKYLSGLLVGVLTAGAVQGSDNEGKMPGLDKKQVNKKFEDQPERNRINVFPITKDNKGLFTQQIFGPNNYIIPDVDQYVVTYPITKKEIGELIVRIKDKRDDVSTNKKLIIVKCQKIKESDLLGKRLIGQKASCNLKPEEALLVDIKSRKCFLPVLITNTYGDVFKAIQTAVENDIEFEKIILDGFDDCFLGEVLPKLNKKNVHSFEFFIRDVFWSKMPSNWVIFLMGCSKCLHVPYLKQIDCGKDLFVVSKQLGLDPYTHSMEFEAKPDCNGFEFYAPFLEQTVRVDSHRGHTKLYWPCVKKICNVTMWDHKYAPEVLYVSPDFDIEQLESYAWEKSVRRYTPEQLEKIEIVKEELLAYIAINPELSNASLNYPKPDNVPQEKWNVLINLKNKLMALLRGENVQRITVIQMN